MEKYIDLAKKLSALAEKGVGGEKINAQEMLQKIMKKHGITREDIEGEKRNKYWFTDVNERLFHQIIGVVNRKIQGYGKFPQEDVEQHGLPGNYMIECTVFEYIQIEGMYSVYEKLYNQELEVFYYAFCKANNLLVTPKERIDASDLSPEELDKYKRASVMAIGIKKGEYRKQLSQH